MRKTLSIILTAVILASTYTQTALALPERLIINSSTNNIEYYDSNAACSTGSGTDLSSVSPGSGAPNGLTYPNLDAAKMADAIEKYIEAHAPDSPLKGTGQKAVASAKKANLSPFLAYAHAMMESSLATTTVEGAQIKLQQGHNAFGRTATDSQPHVVEADRNWYMWTSFEASVDAEAEENKNVDSGDWFSYDRAVFSDEIDQGMTAYVERYAPRKENPTDEYISFMQGALDEMAGYAGASVATASTASTTASSSSTTDCCATPTKGGGVVKMLSDNPETALGYLMSAGNGTKLTLAQAAGVVGNLQVESSPNVDPRASNGTHIGIAQWDDNRWNNGVVKFAADMNGENWTYNANLQGIVRSNQATTYPAFYQAAHYTPGVATASSIGRWYLPSYGELIKFVQVFQKGFTPTATEPVSPHYDQMSTGFLSKVQNAFTQVSKPTINGQFIISSTQVYGGTPSLGFRPAYINIWSGDQLYTGFCWNTIANGAILPFVHF